MKRVFRKAAVALGIVLMGTVLTLQANAACGILDGLKPGASPHPQSFEGGNSFEGASLLLASDHDNDSIVGMWRVTLTAMGNPGGPPDGAVLDSALVQWHSDGTEIMNSARPPQDGDICLGVWERTGRSRYKLNHFARGGNDTNHAQGGVGDPAGPTQIVADVFLSRDGNHYTGMFTLDAYDLSGTNPVHVVGVMTATRITVHSQIGDVL